MKARISIVTLGVTDLERARAFYVDGLGLPLRPESVEGEVCFIEMAGCWLALWDSRKLAEDAGVTEEGGGFRRFSLGHNVSEKHEVDEIAVQVAAAGGAVIRPPQDTFYGGYAAYFSDPDGFLWEVVWNPHIPELAF